MDWIFVILTLLNYRPVMPVDWQDGIRAERRVMPERPSRPARPTR